jgi:hypothetical protein
VDHATMLTSSLYVSRASGPRVAGPRLRVGPRVAGPRLRSS